MSAYAADSVVSYSDDGIIADTVKPVVHEQIFFDKFSLTMCQIFFARVRSQQILFVDVAATLRQVVGTTRSPWRRKEARLTKW